MFVGPLSRQPPPAARTYSLAAIEARLACEAVGLHPALGFVHADEPQRDNLALDLLEPVRPEVERFVLDLVAERTFRPP
jgi:CRISPR-associated protein Cas1